MALMVYSGAWGKLIHEKSHDTVPLMSPLSSLHGIWTTNIMRNPLRVLRNANELYVPAHHLATVRRFPIFSFPLEWNQEADRKLNPSLNVYCKMLKSALLASLVD